MITEQPPPPPSSRAADARPPRAAERLLGTVLPSGLVGETILGDLHQELDELAARRGRLAAALWYWVVALELAGRYARRAARRRLPYRLSGDDPPRRTPMLDAATDLRYGFRMLRRTPLISAAAVLTLAAGIGMTVHTFSVVYGTVLRGLPLPDGDRLTILRHVDPSAGGGGFGARIVMPLHDYLAFRDQSRSFEGLGAYTYGTLNLAGDGEPPERYLCAFVSANALPLLGVAPHLGRLFRDGEDAPGADPALVISWELWQSRFGGSPSALGRSVRANDVTASIVGVMPRGFRFPFDSDAWMPHRQDPGALGPHDGEPFMVFGRLATGATLESASAEAAAINERLAQDHPDEHGEYGSQVRPFEEAYMPPEVILPIRLQLLAVAGVLWIACANVANLLLARSAVRRHEVAIRTALGAGRLRLVRQLLAETLAIALVGGLLGLLLAKLGVDAFNRALAPIERPYWIDVRIDGPAAFVAIGATLAAALLSGLLPALRATGSAAGALVRSAGRGSGLRLGRLSSGLVVAEVAASAALLVLAGLTVKSLVNANSIDLGFRTQDVLAARVGLFEGDYPDAAARLQFFGRLRARLAASPGIEGVALATSLPGLGAMRLTTAVEGEAYRTIADYPVVNAVVVSEGFFRTLDVPLLQGRELVAADAEPGAEPVAVVNESLARRRFGGEALGRRLRVGADGTSHPWMRVVGVVPDLHIGGGVGGLGDDRVDPAAYYVPMSVLDMHFMSVLVRTEGPPEGAVPALRAIVAELDPNLPVYDVASLAQAIESSTWAFGLFAGMFSSLGAVALLLATVGLYGVVAFTVARRTREVGVRMALGARGRDVLRLIVAGSARQLAIGLTIGLTVGALIARPLAAVTFGVRPGDPSVYLAILLLLAITGLTAAFVPARRATRIDPSIALRAE